MADASDRARLSDLLTGDLGALAPGTRSPLVRSEDLWLVADGFARERAVDRNALRARLDAASARTMHDCDTARHQLEHLNGWRRTLREGADWARQLHAALPEHVGAFEAARDALDERRIEQRTAQHDLERVLEQRNAAAAAIEEADRELAELAGSGMDESGLRRELEAAGQAVRVAEEVHSTARAHLEELQIEASGLQVRREAAQPKAVGRPTYDTEETAAIAAVRDALAAVQSVMIDGEVDRTAEALADAWTDLHADLARIGGPGSGPSDDEVARAEARLAAAVAVLAGLDAEASANALTPEQRAELDAAHAEVLDAEEHTGSRFGGGAARKRLEEAHTNERALLDRYGFGGYLDVVLSGGRASVASPERTAAEREHFEANQAYEALASARRADPELDHLRSERSRLHGQIVELLGVDPGDDVVSLLRAHRPLARALQAPLADALAAVGVQPVGVSLDEAAAEFLAAHPLPEPEEEEPEVDERPDSHLELAVIEARWAALEGELERAQSEVDRSAEALQMAERSVDAFESELTVRAGEDVARLKRFAAAEQLRSQIDAVAGTLRRAEEEAREVVEAAGQLVAAAESAFEACATEVGDLARRARKLAEELPIDLRPEGDPLRTLLELADRLDAHSEVLQPEIDRAEAAVATASVQLEEALAARRLAGDGDEGPLAEDLLEGLQVLLDEATDQVLVLDEPFVGVDAAVRNELLDIVRTGSADHQIVLLTEDADVLGWAIELPIDEAAALPADALIARMRRPVPDRTAAPERVLAASRPRSAARPLRADSVDITAPDAPAAPADLDPVPEPAPVPTARRWAGQR